MSPEDIAGDEVLLARFQKAVAYIDRGAPSTEEHAADVALLRSAHGVQIVAWLWPERVYLPDHDPFEIVDRHMHGRRVELDRSPSIDEVFAVVDGMRAWRRQVVAHRLVRILETGAQYIGCSVPDLLAHVSWATPLRPQELDAILRGEIYVPFATIVALCRVLHLEFEGLQWKLVDAARLARSVERSLIARRVSGQLAHLSLRSLASVEKKIPQRKLDGEEGLFDAYRSPRPSSRYRAIYEALAADSEGAPEYSLAELDAVLDAAGEPRLPDSARSDRSWWAGSGARPEARPQVSAWWGAGYRVRNIVKQLGSDRIDSVIFEALPGRERWLDNPDRMASGEFRPPDPLRTEIPADTVAVYPNLAGVGDALLMFARGVESLIPSTAVSDPDIETLLQFLADVGEADRGAIEQHFEEIEQMSADDARISNLLTRARRRGRIANRGTKARPRWVIVGMS